MDVIEKIERLKNKEEEMLCVLNHIEFIKIHMGKMTEEEELILSMLSKRSMRRLMGIHKILDDISEIINLANEL